MGDPVGAAVVGEILGANVAVLLRPWLYNENISACSKAEPKIKTLSMFPVKNADHPAPPLPSVPTTIG
jgi:hypothetical protein